MATSSRKRTHEAAKNQEPGVSMERKGQNGGSKIVDVEDHSGELIGGGQSAWRQDLPSIVLLLVLYTLQGIPMGLSGSIPFLLLDKVSYSEQAIFSLVSLPFSMKLLWAPLVDSLYFSSFGRRKSWLVPAQLLCGAMMIWARSVMDDWIGKDGGEPHIKTLTVYFLALYFFMATQDIAVDGWALTMLSRKNVGFASMCNTMGQALGFFISQVGFLALYDPDVCNKYFRKAHQVPGGGSSAQILVWLVSAVVLHEVASNCMCVAQMAFCSRISDPVIGGTYMTLLNTMANLGGKWPNTLSLYMLERLTWKRCVTQEAGDIVESDDGRDLCQETGGSCVIWLDGYTVQMVQTNACTCIAVYYTPCDYVTGLASGASLVVRATALSRSLQTDINDPITYTVDVTTVFLGDTGGQDEIAFLTPGNSAACGISLEIGEEYVLALFPYTVLEDPFDLTGGSEGGLSVEACGLWRKWSDIPSEEKADLEAGCPAEDLCIPICDEDQARRKMTRGFEAHVLNRPSAVIRPSLLPTSKERYAALAPEAEEEDRVIDYTPHYAVVPEVPYRIRRIYGNSSFDGDTKYFVLLREPVARAISAWEFRFNMYSLSKNADPKKVTGESRPLEQAVREGTEDVDALLGCLDNNQPRPSLPWELLGLESIRELDLNKCHTQKYWGYNDHLLRHHVGNGMYALHLERWFAVVGRQNVKVLFLEELDDDPVKTLEDLFEFIGLGLIDRSGRKVTSALVQRMRDFFAPHNARLEELLDRRLPDSWSGPTKTDDLVTYTVDATTMYRGAMIVRGTCGEE
eukprot:g3985.t1